MGVLPKTLKSKASCVYFQMYSPSTTRYLPKACCRPTWNSLRWPGVDDGVGATGAGEDEVFVEGRLHGAGVRRAEDCIGGLQVISDAEPRFCLCGMGEPVVFIEAQSQIEGPVLYGDGVLNKEAEFLDIGVAVPGVFAAGAVGAAIGRGERTGTG
jgi:hypothetical protein